MKLESRTRRIGALLLAGYCSALCAGQQVQLPSYSPAPLDEGVVRSWGDDAMRGTMLGWEAAFRKYHPEITFVDTLYGTGTGMAGIITGVSDLSLMGRPVTVNEVIGFEWVRRAKPLGIQVVTGGLAGDGKSPALAVFVSARNPVNQISMAQLATILGCPSDSRTPPTWSMAGAQGSWANKPVHAYVFDSGTGTGAFLQQAVQGAKDCWNWSMVDEFKDIGRADGSNYSAAQQTLDALRRDPSGLAISSAGLAQDGVKLLALGGRGSAINPTPETLIDERYPLTRGVYVYINRETNKPVDARIKEFLRFILSEEGQAIARKQDDYLPLSPSIDLEQMKKLQ